MTLEEIKALLGRYGLAPNHLLGQHFLLDDDVLDAVVRAASISKGDIVLEIGPGIGNLTERMAKTGARVVAVEKDRSFGKILKDIAFRYNNLEVVFADILRADISTLVGTGQWKVAANLPYYLTGAVIQLLLRMDNPPSSITVLIQKEVAENMTAQPGNMNLLGLSVQLVGKARIVVDVPAKSFYPPPKVVSSVVHIARIEPKVSKDEEKAVFRVAKACFAGKRKQIHNTLAAGLHLPPDEALKVLAALDIDPKTRPQELAVDDFVRLAHAVGQVS